MYLFIKNGASSPLVIVLLPMLTSVEHFRTKCSSKMCNYTFSLVINTGINTALIYKKCECIDSC